MSCVKSSEDCLRGLDVEGVPKPCTSKEPDTPEFGTGPEALKGSFLLPKTLNP